MPQAIGDQFWDYTQDWWISFCHIINQSKSQWFKIVFMTYISRVNQDLAGSGWALLQWFGSSWISFLPPGPRGQHSWTLDHGNSRGTEYKGRPTRCLKAWAQKWHIAASTSFCRSKEVTWPGPDTKACTCKVTWHRTWVEAGLKNWVHQCTLTWVMWSDLCVRSLGHNVEGGLEGIRQFQRFRHGLNECPGTPQFVLSSTPHTGI